MDKLSNGPAPIVIADLAAFRVGSIIVVVASVYSSMGDVRINALTIFARRMADSRLVSAGSDASAFANTLAPSETKNEKNIQTARAARAEVAVLRNRIENKMATPSQNEM